MQLNVQKLIAPFHGLNRPYADSLISYLAGDLRHDPQALREAITDIVDNMVAATADGQTLKDYFCDDLQTAADDILAELPRRKFGSWCRYWWPIVNVAATLILASGLVRLPASPRASDLTANSGYVVILVLGLWAPRGFNFNKLRPGALGRLAGFILLGFALSALIMFLLGLLPDCALPVFVLALICVGFGVVNVVMSRLKQWPLLVTAGMWDVMGVTFIAGGFNAPVAVQGVLFLVNVLCWGASYVSLFWVNNEQV